jgi:general secretion pathway protein G
MRHSNYSIRLAEWLHVGEASREPWRRVVRSLNRRITGTSAGFTLIELLVVLALIVILASVGLAQYKNSVIYSKQAVLKDDLFKLNDAIDQYYADKGQYPNSLESLVTDGYMRAIPVDPFTNSATTWQTVPAEPDPNNPTALGGIYAVRSGSDGTALDGTKYADWQ